MYKFEEMISTSSKKEFQKNWTELEQLARYQLPKEYRKRVAEAREKFGLR
jgi:ribosome-binding protein aMBF1 (putative translation factor)